MQLWISWDLIPIIRPFGLMQWGAGLVTVAPRMASSSSTGGVLNSPLHRRWEGWGLPVHRGFPGFGKTVEHLVGQFMLSLRSVCFLMRCKWAFTFHIYSLMELVVKIGVLGLVQGIPE